MNYTSYKKVFVLYNSHLQELSTITDDHSKMCEFLPDFCIHNEISTQISILNLCPSFHPTSSATLHSTTVTHLLNLQMSSMLLNKSASCLSESGQLGVARQMSKQPWNKKVRIVLVEFISRINHKEVVGSGHKSRGTTAFKRGNTIYTRVNTQITVSSLNPRTD